MDRLKPHPQMYLEILAKLEIPPKNAWIVGDSLGKDVAPAIAIGANGVWARYGRDFDKRNFDTILEITHWSDSHIAQVYDDRAVVPTAVIDSFSELQRIVRTIQMNLL